MKNSNGLCQLTEAIAVNIIQIFDVRLIAGLRI
jgi:hypothetical protein